ncbi:MAG: class I SAM-dependent methyltransferase [Polyangiaceae bacterium]|nr:class I SAM-dependent methyltransferase [Myxococcales bacterium]MCB9585366.1 class I SAM-dependent methyltransferase [Polyangiaceae bacterium]MCB9606619.1 class I SAM-dependent methyltransferase [Polyangiaceae bacterium]
MSGLDLSKLGHAGDFGALAHYADPAYYSKAYRTRREDVEFYVRLAERVGGPVLEYAVGNGRVALPMARAGLDVWGVDLSAPMLESLKERLGKEERDVQRRIQLARGDMRTWRTRRRFPLIISAFNSVLHLYTRDDVEAFFRRVQAHLVPGGRFVFDFSLPRPADLALDPDRNYSGMRLRDPSSGKLVKYSERFEYDPVRQIQLCWMQFQPLDGSEPWAVPLTHRQFFPQEMEALLHYAGFREIEFSADFEERPLDVDSDWVVVSCRSPHRAKQAKRRK